AVLLPATHADRTQMDKLVDIASDAVYLFDRGYVDYKKFDVYCEKGLRFVTRLKKNAEIEIVSENTPDPNNLIFQDAKVYLGSSVSGTKMQYPLRMIRTIDDDGNPVTIITSCSA